MSSPTSRSLDMLREIGYTCQVVEYYHHPSKKRRDLFGCIDIVAAHPDLGILGVQATSGSNHSARFKKACRCPVYNWLKGGAHLQVWSWQKRGKVGQKKLWGLRVQQVTLKDLKDTP